MSNIVAYIVLILAGILALLQMALLKVLMVFSIDASLLTTITIVGCMFTVSIVMKTIPVGITHRLSLCIIATTIVGVYKFNQMPIFTL